MNVNKIMVVVTTDVRMCLAPTSALVEVALNSMLTKYHVTVSTLCYFFSFCNYFRDINKDI